jgi:ubiquinone/menaquinone biosynthesis C-methylase UbiE
MNTKRGAAVIDWEAYARSYDMLLSYNPFYQELHRQVMDRVRNWTLPPGGDLVDLGAGTGNYSIPTAEMFPELNVWHIDNNRGMNAVARGKARNLKNFKILEQGIEETDFSANSLHGLLCINAIYTFPDPEAVLCRMHRWMKPGFRVILVDPGRVMKLFSWQVAIGRHLLKTYGLRKTIDIFKKAKVVSQQNKYIREMQKNKTYWTHTHEAFCTAVKAAGFQVESSALCFRGYCDMVVALKK